MTERPIFERQKPKTPNHALTSDLVGIFRPVLGELPDGASFRDINDVLLADLSRCHDPYSASEYAEELSGLRETISLLKISERAQIIRIFNNILRNETHYGVNLTIGQIRKDVGSPYLSHFVNGEISRDFVNAIFTPMPLGK